jgi:8-oxo-dGTP pyrophosphatase MutT (NUDIX family)
VVFPGGKVDASDAAALALASPVPARARAFEAEETSALALCVAACRETLEEAGIVPLLDGTPEIAALLRADLAAGASLADALASRGARLDLALLEPFARWVTPEAEQRRFDARFFLLALPPGQEASHDQHETTQSFWASPAEVLRRFEAGEVFLAPPTTRTLELLRSIASYDDARALARAQGLDPVCPRFLLRDGVAVLALPGDPEHPVGERRVAGPTRFVLRDGRFVSEDPPALRRDER